MILTQLFKWIDEINFLPVKQWNKAQNILLTYLDAQIEIVWEFFLNSVDKIERQFDCTRAKEEPQDNNGNWSAAIPKCRNNNTTCKINKFIICFLKEIGNLNTNLNDLPLEQKTKELEKIHKISQQVIETQKFQWQGTMCRQIGDLLIGLESKAGIGLISSNYKEHSILSNSLGYNFKHFEVSKIDGLVKSRKTDFLPQHIGVIQDDGAIYCGQNKMLGLFTRPSKLDQNKGQFWTSDILPNLL